MFLEEHMKEANTIFGKPYKEVHLWLDAYYKKLGIFHRRKRHHLKGVEKVFQKWGEEAALAARQHIESDLKDDGWDSKKAPFPINEQHYISMGFR